MNNLAAILLFFISLPLHAQGKYERAPHLDPSCDAAAKRFLQSQKLGTLREPSGYTYKIYQPDIVDRQSFRPEFSITSQSGHRFAGRLSADRKQYVLSALKPSRNGADFNLRADVKDQIVEYVFAANAGGEHCQLLEIRDYTQIKDGQPAFYHKEDCDEASEKLPKHSSQRRFCSSELKNNFTFRRPDIDIDSVAAPYIPRLRRDPVPTTKRH